MRRRHHWVATLGLAASDRWKTVSRLAHGCSAIGTSRSELFSLDVDRVRSNATGTVSPRLRRLLPVALVAWCVLLGFGLRTIFAHATAAGARGSAPSRWPAESHLPRGTGATVAIFVHPDCPCSRASLAELASLSRNASIAIDVVVAGPDAAGELWDQAGAIPGAHRLVDDGGEAARFGARTSGHVVVYDRTGALQFAGGITGERGHVGDNAGRASVQRILDGERGASAEHPVFGCALGAPP